MNTKRAGKSHLTIAILVTTGVATLAFSAASQAGCADATWSGAPQTRAGDGLAHFSDVVYRPGEIGAARAFLVGDNQDEIAPIVGFWTFEWRAKANPALPNDNPGIPDGALLDFGLIQWHPDGTEITNSGGRTPAVGDVCMGSWTQVAPSTFKLTHLALGYGPPPGPVMGYQGSRDAGQCGFRRSHLSRQLHVDSVRVEVRSDGPRFGIRPEYRRIHIVRHSESDSRRRALTPSVAPP